MFWFHIGILEFEDILGVSFPSEFLDGRRESVRVELGHEIRDIRFLIGCLSSLYLLHSLLDSIRVNVHIAVVIGWVVGRIVIRLFVC